MQGLGCAWKRCRHAAILQPAREETFATLLLEGVTLQHQTSVFGKSDPAAKQRGVVSPSPQQHSAALRVSRPKKPVVGWRPCEEAAAWQERCLPATHGLTCWGASSACVPRECPFKAICRLLSCIINLISVIAAIYVMSINTGGIP